jgi:hypothetical protein
VPADGFKLDVIAHDSDDIFCSPPILQVRVEVESSDYFKQLCSAHDPLGDDLDAFLSKARNGAPHKLSGNLLPLDNIGGGIKPTV